MTINGKVHCFFEQSGTFKNEFIKLGIPAEDYDIQNNFGQTDHVVDLFAEIEAAYDGRPSVFDRVAKTDLVLAFFPCIHFCELSCLNMRFDTYTKKGTTTRDAFEFVLKKNESRAYFFSLLNKMFFVCIDRGIRMILENPYNGGTYLRTSFPKPQVYDKNRMLRGDFCIKPTGYWFTNCEPTHGFTNQNDKKQKIIHAKTTAHARDIKAKGMQFLKSAKKSGQCSEERSMISSDYARNFICDWVIGKAQPDINPTLFDY